MKFLKLLNIKNWMQSFVGKIILQKGVKHAVTVIVGLVAGAQVQSILQQFGVSIDIPHFTEQLQILFGGAAGSLLNWAQKVIDPDGDGVPGTAVKS